MTRRLVLWLLIVLGSILPAVSLGQKESEAFAQLQARLDALAGEWNQLPSPHVPISGQSGTEVLRQATDQEQARALTLFNLVTNAPAGEKQALLRRILAAESLSEVDIWLPKAVVDSFKSQFIFAKAAETINVWLLLAAASARKDLLLHAVAEALYLLSPYLPTDELVKTAGRWAAVSPSTDEEIPSWATVVRFHASLLLRLGRNKEALDAYQSSRKRRGRLGAAIHIGYLNLEEADSLALFGQYQEAIKSYRESRSLFNDLGCKPSKKGMGNSWLGEARSLIKLGYQKQAREAYQHAQFHYDQLDDAIGQGDAWLGEADALFNMKENNGALAAYRRARDLFGRNNNNFRSKQGQANALHGEADVYFRLGQNQAALDAYRNARLIFQDIKDYNGQGNSWQGEGDVLFRLGQNHGALDAYQRARRLHEQLRSELGQANSWQGEADVLLRLGQYRCAIEAFRRARSSFEKANDTLGLGNSWLGEAQVLSRQGQDQPALDGYREGRGRFEQVGDLLGQGNSWLGEARVYSRRNEYQKALEAFQHARSRLERVGDLPGQGDSWQGEAEVRLLQGQADAARAASIRAISLCDASQTLGCQYTARLVQLRALVRLGQKQEIERVAMELLPFSRKWRQHGLTDWDRVRLADQVMTPYTVLVTQLAESAPRRAMEVAEEAHAPVLTAWLNGGRHRPLSEIQPNFKQGMLDLQQKRAELARIQPGYPTPEILEAQQKIEQDYETLYRNALLAELKPVSDRAVLMPFSEQQALVLKTGPVLLFYVASEQVIGFLLRAEDHNPIVRRIPLPLGTLQERVGELRKVLGNGLFVERANALAEKLGVLLLGPFEKELQGLSSLRIIPHGPLHDLPWEGLRVSGQPLAFSISQAPSLSVLATLHQRRAALPTQEKPELVALASGEGLVLPNREIDTIATLFQSGNTKVYREQADVDSYLRFAPRARYLFISSHGARQRQSRTTTYLELKARDNSDGRLSAVDIAETKLQAELVTLAACDTARAEASYADERLDLVRAYLLAGSAAVLATRWHVPDSESTTQFLFDFFTELRARDRSGTAVRKDQALLRARQKAQARGDSPRLWAAWVLIGDGG